MSPEQAAGRIDELGFESDIYSLGATLYYVLTGKMPFSGQLESILQQIQRGEFARPRQVQPAVDPALEAICLKAMALEAADRYGSDLSKDVERWLAGEPPSAYREPVIVKTKRWIRNHPKMVTCIVTAVLATVVSTSAILQKNQQLRDKQREADEVFDYLNVALSPGNSLADVTTAGPTTPITVEPLIDNAVAHLEGRFTERPQVKMNFLRTWGLLYLGSGSGPKAAATLHQLSDLSTTTLGAAHPQTTLAMTHLAVAYQSSGQLAEAAAINRKILEFRTHRLGGQHEDTIGAMTNLGFNLRLLTQPDEASRLLEKSLETSKQYLPPQHHATLHAAARTTTLEL